MKLYLLRHSNATERGSGKSAADDTQRPLTSAGRKKMAKIMRALRNLDLQVDLIFSSPYLRASETAVIAQDSLHMKNDQLILTKQLAPLGDSEQLIAEINSHDPIDNVLLVGHEPELSELTSLLISGEPSISITLKKGGICCLSTDALIAGKCATLEWLLNPSQLEAIE